MWRGFWKWWWGCIHHQPLFQITKVSSLKFEPNFLIDRRMWVKHQWKQLSSVLYLFLLTTHVKCQANPFQDEAKHNRKIECPIPFRWCWSEGVRPQKTAKININEQRGYTQMKELENVYRTSSFFSRSSDWYVVDVALCFRQSSKRCNNLLHTKLFSEIFCVQQIYLAFPNVTSNISLLCRRHHRNRWILTQSQKNAKSKTKYCLLQRSFGTLSFLCDNIHSVATRFLLERGQCCLYGKKSSSIGDLKNVVTMQQICLNISYASSMCCGSTLFLKTSRLCRFEGLLLSMDLFGWQPRSLSPRFGSRWPSPLFLLLLSISVTWNSRAWCPPSSQSNCLRTLSTRFPSTLSYTSSVPLFSTSKKRPRQLL